MMLQKIFLPEFDKIVCRLGEKKKLAGKNIFSLFQLQEILPFIKLHRTTN